MTLMKTAGITILSQTGDGLPGLEVQLATDGIGALLVGTQFGEELGIGSLQGKAKLGITRNPRVQPRWVHGTHVGVERMLPHSSSRIAWELRSSHGSQRHSAIGTDPCRRHKGIFIKSMFILKEQIRNLNLVSLHLQRSIVEHGIPHQPRVPPGQQERCLHIKGSIKRQKRCDRDVG